MMIQPARFGKYGSPAGLSVFVNISVQISPEAGGTAEMLGDTYRLAAGRAVSM
jgi:hypothetical protein